MFRHFPYEDSEFDSVVAIQSIYHGFREDMQKSIFEISRVLKSDGVFVFTLSRDKKRSTTLNNSVNKRRNLIAKIDEMTYLPISGREKGMVHFYPTKDIVKEMLGGYFANVIIEEDNKNNYLIVKCIKK